MSKIDPKLFSAHEHALEKAYQVCPKCGGELVHRQSKAGPFLGCSQYPSCDYKRSLHSNDHSLEKRLPGTECPECGEEMMLRQGRYGMFIGCSNFPECQHIESAQPKTEETKDIRCPSCSKGSIVARQSRYGKTFYACDAYPKCRYAVNDKPRAETCPDCGWELLVEKQYAAGMFKICPQKSCNYKEKIDD
ncbi:DNA topoisomerase family protein [Aliagarivorans taiwanensis]|uniref:DNA topoisomerase family protein n=1 Tax=Aliagarivorans taiwanensis TaxID=561966 RepID=UPI0004063B74|nr:topoisomerase DNA-binding C4 zinc finger domain-containing protein [Aliagarivorans taiwanensis]